MAFVDTLARICYNTYMSIFESICFLLCGVGVFLTGMKLMGDGLGKGSNRGLRALFGRISNNRLASYGLGAGATAIVQSSAATTVMSMGLVNAGIMTLYQAGAFVLGARLGTTITGILVSLSSISIIPVLMALAFVGMSLMIFIKKDRAQAIGYVLTGLGVLFAGMEIMKSAISNQQDISNFFVNLFNAIDFPLLLVLVGAAFTALLQSSSATTGILITLISAGTLQVSQALFILIGATVGTCITALIAGVGAGVNAKRVAVFNVLTAILGAIVVGGLVWIFRTPVTNALGRIINSAEWQLSLFGVVYSLVSSALCLPLIKPLGKLVTAMVRERGTEATDLRCYYIDDRLLTTPAVAVMQAQKEVAKLAELAHDNLMRGIECVLSASDKDAKLINHEETRVDYITKRVSEYLVALAAGRLSYEDELLVGSLHHVIDDLERIGDHGVDFMKMARKMNAEGLSFSTAAIEELRVMSEHLESMYQVAYRAFVTRDDSQLMEVSRYEDILDKEKKQLANNHLDRLVSGDCNIETGTFFYTAISSIERVGDHLENLAFSIRSITGSTKD